MGYPPVRRAVGAPAGERTGDLPACDSYHRHVRGRAAQRFFGRVIS